jgi:hypothetical protein
MYNVSSTKTRIAGNGAVLSSRSPRHAGVDKWRGSWNGNKFAPPNLSTCVLYYPGHPGAGTTITDFSSTGDTGTLTGTSWTRASSGLYVPIFDGSDDRITASVVPQITIASAFSIVFWMNSTLLGSLAEENVLNNVISDEDRFSITLGSPEAIIRCGIYNNVAYSAKASGNLTAGYHFYVYTYDGAGNGLLTIDNVTQSGTTQPSIGGVVGLTIGFRPDGTRWFKGVVALLRAYTGVMSASEKGLLFMQERSLFNV